MKDLFAREALSLIPKILTLQDRNPASPTYGCFDRNFWHYKIIDFPSGMAQEFVWPLALVYTLDLPDNPYRGQQAIREWIIAGLHYMARSAHADGSCDDYFPYEKAGGAAAFSLLAGLESYRLLGLNDPVLLAFFEKRANWLAHHHESGRLTNHQALIVLCLELTARLLDRDPWVEARQARLNRVLEWQNEEGWFQEYEGADPGYHTLTVGLLAQVQALRPDERVRAALQKAVRFAAEFIHPDGSFGGEYTSRNTYNFFPHGFELLGAEWPEALAINDKFLQGLAAGLGACYADDHILGHHAWSYLLAWQHFQPNRPGPAPRREGRVHFPQAGLLIDRRGDTELYLALNKGGAFRLFRRGVCVASDTQWSLTLESGGKRRNAVGHLVGSAETTIEDNSLTLQGTLGWAKQKQMTTFNLLVLRGVMLSAGRFFPNLIRKLLQKLLITGKTAAPFTYKRVLQWQPDGSLLVHDEVRPTAGWEAVRAAGIGPAQTSIYVVMSRTFQRAQLLPWIDLTPALSTLGPQDPLIHRRTL